MATISLRLSDADSELVHSFAKLKNMTVSALAREALLERIEDEIDRRMFDKAMEEFKKNPVTYTHEEVVKMLELE